MWDGGTSGKYNGSLEFDGTDDYVSVGNLGSVGNTVSVWVKPSSTTQKILELSGSAYLEISAGSVSATGFTAPTIYVDGQVSSSLSTGWHYVSVTSATTESATSTTFGQVGSESFSGALDEVRLSATARSAAWIQTEYNNQSDPSAFFAVQAEETGPGPVGHWSFDEGSGATVRDGTANGGHGVITGAVRKSEEECVSGGCLYLDGNGDKVTIPDFDL